MDINTLIIGAGAAGMMCAAHAGPGTLIVDHAKSPGEKIRISGGGRCNFTNMDAGPANFISQNPHFCKSALKRYTQWDFIALVDSYRIAWHEKTLGQLFCDDTAKDIVAMLRSEMDKAGAQLWLQTSVDNIRHDGHNFRATLMREGKITEVIAKNLVVACGGKSIPKMGATGFAYQIAAQFDLPVVETRAGLVPFTFGEDRFKPLAGVALPARVSAHGPAFDEALLFTHRGLSGPAILQASSYWNAGNTIDVNLDPAEGLLIFLRAARQNQGRKALTTVMGQYLPARLVDFLSADLQLTGNIADQSDTRLQEITDQITAWILTPSGTEGYRTAEVTLGGVDTDALSSKTMGAKSVPGLYFIGECVDVTGWLGGYNFQWAWSSGWAAGQAIANT
ncbi:aminoacetone oxidase family FAD-binding enzyme [Loktanella sp. D2R18]|uniref:NAD(P)/FAD-dependent oxidoreductase n=1 Tax=Rhodobacterales TaxID=204455 RepID=UPI000DEB39EC|nr:MULTISPECIES: NAD(P)/FAD-dependent oxidoreductase [Rhodobacterales]MDO6589093.1 NAD(P)/FAD-dependent oxidoreductase [Yoonia sp. 1_MG-2023]RBW45469.1 aminoacetone oxidase family FAD-binding enzyme [Loktanella sp. D2R18]